MKLLKDPDRQVQNFKKGTVKFIYNDYHVMGSKPGFSRNALGTFYTR